MEEINNLLLINLTVLRLLVYRVTSKCTLLQRSVDVISRIVFCQIVGDLTGRHVYFVIT